jgi:hypothetical protein
LYAPLFVQAGSLQVTTGDSASCGVAAQRVRRPMIYCRSPLGRWATGQCDAGRVGLAGGIGVLDSHRLTEPEVVDQDRLQRRLRRDALGADGGDDLTGGTTGAIGGAAGDNARDLDAVAAEPLNPGCCPKLLR